MLAYGTAGMVIQTKGGFQRDVEVVPWPRMDTAQMQVLGRLKRNLNHQPHQDLRFIWVMGEVVPLNFTCMILLVEKLYHQTNQNQ